MLHRLRCYRVLAVAAVLLSAGCGASGRPVPDRTTAPGTSSSTPTGASPSPSPPSSSPSTQPPPSTPPAPVDPAQRVLAGLTLQQRVGQLVMVAASDTAADPAATAAVENYAVGGVILMGTSRLSVAQTAALTARLQAAAPPEHRLLIATDQEGGLVQRLQGPGFGAIPSAVVQGRLDPATLRSRTAVWASALAQAGVRVDLAPVADTVTPGAANPPIGDLDRQYGATPAAVSTAVTAVAAGLRDGGVAATVKHFPGLGRVSANTDTTSGVVDPVTTATDPDLAPFRAAVAAGIPLVMISTAVYSRIDPSAPAAFSPTVINGLLRGSLGFRGVVISDDLGAAKQVSGVDVGQRAVRFVAAGGDIVLTVVAQQAGAMTAALAARSRTDPAFAAAVDAAALRVLRLKAALGLPD